MAKSDPQPAKGVLALRRFTNRSIAQRLGKSEHWVGRVLNGQVPPPRDFRTGLAAMLGLPEETLFR